MQIIGLILSIISLFVSFISLIIVKQKKKKGNYKPEIHEPIPSLPGVGKSALISDLEINNKKIN